MAEYNVSESVGTVEVVLVANGMSDFNYTVNLTVYDVTTGEFFLCVRVCLCGCMYVCVDVCTYVWMYVRMCVYVFIENYCAQLEYMILCTDSKRLCTYVRMYILIIIKELKK